jgi:hypothetical protein
MKRLIVLTFCLLIIGCTSQIAQLEQQWLGKDRSTLITAKGTPDRIVDDDLGGQIYTYIRTASFALSGYATTQPSYGIYPFRYGWQYGSANTAYYPPRTSTERKKTMFWINSTGEIYKVSITR